MAGGLVLEMTHLGTGDVPGQAVSKGPRKGSKGKGEREGGRKGREGKGREGKGREGKGREGKGREGRKGREEGKGREGKGRRGEGREGEGREGKERGGKGREGEGRGGEGRGREGKGEGRGESVSEAAFKMMLAACGSFSRQTTHEGVETSSANFSRCSSESSATGSVCGNRGVFLRREGEGPFFH